MKLLNHTSKYLAILLLPFITIWAVVFYFAMLDEIYDSIDDGLENQKILLEKRLQYDQSILRHTDFNLGNYMLESISEAEARNFDDLYYDTLMYMQNEEDYEPVRLYESVIKYDNNYFILKIGNSMVEEDDLVETMLQYLVLFYFILIALVLLLNNLLLKKIWSSFYHTINQLKQFKIERGKKIQPNPTKIDEFILLNESVTKLIRKSVDTYAEQKQFIENASHELQTPLAISINKLELFLENNTLDERQMAELAMILENLDRLTRLNKSLLLLSKIENRQFVDESLINFNDLIEKIVLDFEDLINHQEVTVKLQLMTELNYRMNEDLAIILLTNLFKNAILYGNKENPIEVNISSKLIIISNYGVNEALDELMLFSRFKKVTKNKHSTGLGLAIAKTICEKYGLILSYSYTDCHIFKISFP